MDRRTLIVTAPARLHFGLIAFGDGHAVQFGGVGLMLDRPATRIRLSRHATLQLHFDDPQRVRDIVNRWLAMRAGLLAESIESVDRLPVAIGQLDRPPSHIGLGTGTQFTLAIAAGLDRWFGIVPTLTPRQATQFGRARRSAVGSHGFFHGGMIVERGKGPHESIGGLLAHVDLPSSWRVVLACPRDQSGPSGALEEHVFSSLPPVELSAAQALRQIVDQSLLPAAQSGDFDAFSCAVYEFGYRAGLSYGGFQRGPFHGPSVQQLVEFIRSKQIEGVGQSSWGPCVFALCRDPVEATALRQQLSGQFPSDRYWIDGSTINRRGHAVSESSEPPITMEEPLPRT